MKLKPCPHCATLPEQRGERDIACPRCGACNYTPEEGMSPFQAWNRGDISHPDDDNLAWALWRKAHPGHDERTIKDAFKAGYHAGWMVPQHDD